MSTTAKVLAAIGGVVLLVFVGCSALVVGAATSQVPVPGMNPPPTTEAADVTPPAGPLTEFSDGVYKVGEDIEPGDYRATLTDGSFGCYVAFLRNVAGEIDDIIGNEISQGPMRITIKADIPFVKVQGCTLVKA